MSQNEEHIGEGDGGPSRTLDAGKLLYEIGSQIGSYKLLRILGEGGFGVVYLAEQEHPIKRLVALKVIKPGMDTRQVIARFETERQALALLDHPNIARVFEAGVTEVGRPYFAMEYVKGIPITEYCDRYKLGTQERLKLFMPLCQAIQHAHHKGIIHRDIKPSNVLVILQDEKPIPKIIDFGVAKALNQRLTERTLVTEQGQFIGTPEYMSPEQAELTGLDVDTRTDIYSLGVLLYELLTGCTPFDPEDLRSKGYGEMQRIIREQDPVKPSTKLTTLGGKLEDIAKRRSATADQLRKSVRGDLDWIVMKAMEKDRTRRYETANTLAMDISHHLNNEPVIARPPSKLYRFRKLVRRNKAVFAGVSAVAAALVIGLTLSGVALVREQQARRIAVAAREIAVAAQEKEAALRQQAEDNERARRHLAYASDISLAQQALAMNDLGRARQLLDDHRPRPGEVEDLRGWEWRYLWQECQSDANSILCRYPNSAYSVSYSPDGKVLAVAGTRQCFVDLWDVPGLKRIKFLQPDEGRLVAFSPRGDLLATDAEKQIRVWRTGTWELAGTLPIPGYVAALKFSADGRRLASLGYPGKITVWETDQWTVIREISGVMSTGWQGVLDFSPDGKAVVLGCFDRHIRVFNLANGNTDVNIPEAHSELITAVAWSPTGSVIASGSGYNGGPIQLWDATTGTRVRELEGHTGWMCQLVFSKDGQRLYSAAGDHTIRIWDVEKRRPPAILRGSTHEVYGIALSPDGRTLASACKDGVVAFWSAEPKPEVELPRIAMGGLPAFSPDSRFLAVPRKEGTVSLFNLATLREDEQIPALDTSGVHMVTYSPKGDLLIIGTREGKIGVWSCAEHRLLCQPPGHNVSIFGFHYRADGTQLLSVDIEGKAILWDTLTWQRVRFFTVPDVGVGDVSSDLRLGAVSAGGDLRWFDETGTRLDKKRGHLHPINRVTFSDDDSRVATTSSDGTVALWDPSSFEQIRMFRGHMQGAHGVAFSPDGRRLATAGGAGHEAIKLWDLSTDLSAQPPRELITLPGKGSLFAWVLFSPDGQWLAAICQTEATFDLWRAPSWAEIEAAEEKLKSGQSL